MRKHLTAALIFVLLALVLTNPLALHIWNAVEDKQDGLLNTWIVAWVGHALLTDPLYLYNTNIFYPYTNTLAFSEVLLPQSLIALPLNLATNNTVFGYNVSLLAMLWLDAFGMYLFVVNLTKRPAAGWIAGAIYAFNPFNLGNFAQMQLLTLGFLPLALLALGKLGEGKHRFKFAFLFAVFFVLQSLSSFYYALLASFAVGVYLLWWLITVRHDLRGGVRRIAVPLLAAVVLSAVVLLPFLLPYFQVQRELGFSRTVQESEPFSASLKQFVEVAPSNVVYGSFLAPNPIKRVGGYALDNLFPGITVIVLAILGVAAGRTRARWFFATLALIAFVLALGPRLYLTSTQATEFSLPYRWLYDLLPPMRALRAPVRFDALINLSALAGLAGLGCAVLLTRLPARRGMWLAVGIMALVAVEYLSLPAANAVVLPVGNEIPEVYQWLAGQPHGVVLELPMMGPNEKKELDISTQYFSTYHWQNTPDGYSGFIPPRRGEVAYEMQSYPNARSLALLRALDVRLVLDRTSGSCGAFASPYDSIKPVGTGRIGDTCVFQIEPAQVSAPVFTSGLYIPSTVPSAGTFNAYLIVVNRSGSPVAVKPTMQVSGLAEWSNGTNEPLTFPMPLVTSSVSVIPLPLHAPAQPGEYKVRIQSSGSILGPLDLSGAVKVGSELAREIVLPASVQLNAELEKSVVRGSTLPVYLKWLPYNKVNAYYSASVRLVNAGGVKVSNDDRQPGISTFLWQPDVASTDTFNLVIPSDIAPGTYRVELLLYQAETDFSALMLDKDFVPQESLILGEVQVK